MWTSLEFKWPPVPLTPVVHCWLRWLLHSASGEKKVLPWPDILDREDMRTEGDSQVNGDRPGPSLTFLVSSRKNSCLLFAPSLQYCPLLCFVCSPRHRRVPLKQWGL